MLIRLKEIENNSLNLESSVPTSSFPELERLSETGELSLLGPVKLRLQAYLISGMVEVDGELETEVEVACGRCLAAMILPVQSHFSMTYTSGPLSVHDEETDEEIELTAEDMNLIPFEGEEIDLTAEIQEQVLISLPVQPLCDENCRGLCPRCGADMNRQPCGCEPEIFNSKFAALKKLKI